MKVNSRRIRDLRKELGLSQMEVAKRAQLHNSSVSLAERNGRVSEDAALKIAAVLHVDLDYISSTSED